MPTFQSSFAKVDIPIEHVTHYVFRNASSYSSKTAIINAQDNTHYSYGKLQEMIHCVSKNLYHKFDFRKGQVLALLMPNHPLYAVYFHGVALCGGAVTPMNYMLSVSEVRHQLVDSGSRMIVTVVSQMDKVKKAIENTMVDTVFVLSDDNDNILEGFNNANVLLEDLQQVSEVVASIDPVTDCVVLPYSSGTTGKSKGVKLTHFNFVANMKQLDSIETGNQVVIGVLPMFHIYGLLFCLTKSLEAGSLFISVPRFDFVEYLTLIQKHKATVLHIVPPIVLALSQKESIVKQYDLSSVRMIITGAAPVPQDVLESVKRQYSIPIKQGYGLTEMTNVVSLTPDNDIRCNSCGPLIPNTELKVINTETGEELEEGQQGELCFRGPQVMLGYLNNEEATDHTIRYGWLHSGDIGYYLDNHLYVTDRLKELIKYNCYQVAPSELESLLLTNENISDAAVIGVPDISVGEIPKAYIVKKQGVELSEQEVIEFVASQVAPYKKIRQVEFIDQIPKSASGKILRRVLRDGNNSS
jgi:acyl-CoA synthetase (AMP-forming)/AMP-acid ligase II